MLRRTSAYLPTYLLTYPPPQEKGIETPSAPPPPRHQHQPTTQTDPQLSPSESPAIPAATAHKLSHLPPHLGPHRNLNFSSLDFMVMVRMGANPAAVPAAMTSENGLSSE